MDKEYLAFIDRLTASVLEAKLAYASSGRQLTSSDPLECTQIAANLTLLAYRHPPVSRNGG
jgi:hypothetical protein